MIWCLEFDFAASHMEESCVDAMQRYEAEEAAEKQVTGPHTPLLLQKAMVTMAPVVGWDMLAPSKYGGKANDTVSSESPSDDDDESGPSEDSEEDSDFEAEKAQKATKVPRCHRAVPKGGKGK